MIPVRENTLNRWVIPLLAAALFFGVLLFLIPYASGYESTKKPLGVLVWILCTTGVGSADYTYCLLVPFIAAYIVFTERGKLDALPVQRSRFAAALIFLGLLLFWLGLRAEVQYFGYAATQVLLAGLVLWLWGPAVFRALLFPWAFFLFVWPLSFLDSTIAFPLRMIVSELAHGILNLFGVDCLRSGTTILSSAVPALGLPMGSRFQIDIADPCSGIRSLFALLMFSALYAYFFLPRLWQQWIVFLSAVPLTIAGNIVRILLLVVGCLHWGEGFAIGTVDQPSWFHEACGFAVYAVALGLELLFGTLLVNLTRRYGKHPTPASAASPAR